MTVPYLDSATLGDASILNMFGDLQLRQAGRLRLRNAVKETILRVVLSKSRGLPRRIVKDDIRADYRPGKEAQFVSCIVR